MAGATRVLIVYDSRYGNTEKAAYTVGEELNEAGGYKVKVSNSRSVEPSSVDACTLLVIGTPTHFGTFTRRTGKFINSLSGRDLKGKRISFFATYFGEDSGKAVEKMESRLRAVNPGVTLIDGHSVDVRGMRGPAPESELEKCRLYGRNLSEELGKKTVMETP